MINSSSFLILPILLQTCYKHSLLNQPNNWTVIAIIQSQKMKIQIWRKYPNIWNGDEDIWRSCLSSRLLAHYQYQIAALSKLRRIFSNFRKKGKMQSSTIQGDANIIFRCISCLEIVYISICVCICIFLWEIHFCGP